MDNLQTHYQQTVAKDLQKQLKLENPMAIPRLLKVVVNMGVKDAVADKKNVDRAEKALIQITGQKPKITKAKKSIATFKLRQGEPIGVMVTLRGKRMYAFIHKLITVVLPRIKDFHGIKRTSFDGRGNYAIGFSEYTMFPEIDPSSVERMQGLEIVITTTAVSDADGLALLESLGMPFQKEGGGRR
jgi:large subunit ribosomal protein L5